MSQADRIYYTNTLERYELYDEAMAKKMPICKAVNHFAEYAIRSTRSCSKLTGVRTLKNIGRVIKLHVGEKAEPYLVLEPILCGGKLPSSTNIFTSIVQRLTHR